MGLMFRLQCKRERTGHMMRGEDVDEKGAGERDAGQHSSGEVRSAYLARLKHRQR